MSSSMEDALRTVLTRVVNLEELLTHQQHMLQQLNEIVVQQQSQLDRTTKQLQVQQERIRWLTENPSTSEILDPREEKPPHY